MGFLVRDDDYDESIRMTGLNRYKQLLSFFAGHWVKLNLITLFGSIPLITAIFYGIATKSLLITISGSFIGGMIFGPFYAALVDSIQRALREDTNNRWRNYKKGFSQNIRCSLLPGGILGLFMGVYSFLFYLIVYTDTIILTLGTSALIIFSSIIFLTFENLYWPQLVLFNQPFKTTLINIILFTSKYLWKMLLIAAIELVYTAFFITFAPYTLILVPFLFLWYIVFLSQFMIYDKLDHELHIEELIAQTQM